MAALHPLTEHVEACLQRDVECGLLHVLEGTLQRVHYKQRELTLVSQCEVWHVRLDPDCQLWFDDRPEILRCFHPLDPVRVICAESEDGLVARALYAWEK